LFPFQKIEKLPRHQRLRKIIKIFHEAERRLADSGILPACAECEYFAALAVILQKDEDFSAAAQNEFRKAADVFNRQAASGTGAVSGEDNFDISEFDEPNAAVRRALNTVRHILTAETGRAPADWDFIGAGGALDPAKRRVFPGMIIYLEDIRSPFNVGAMFRTAESFGAEKILLSPLCADPRHPRALRSAMGCVEIMSWERVESLNPAVPLFALETGGTELNKFDFPKRGILAVGSEELGVSPQTLAAVSLGRVSIPCYGAKGSLNVSTAFGIVMQAWAAAQHLRT
jgi:TrmH family RNA methyltransferase